MFFESKGAGLGGLMGLFRDPPRQKIENQRMVGVGRHLPFFSAFRVAVSCQIPNSYDTPQRFPPLFRQAVRRKSSPFQDSFASTGSRSEVET
jgi:hypothetical protein